MIIMAQTMKDILNRMLNHEELTREEMKNILIGITQSEYPTEQITALLTALQMRGVTVDELLGFRDGILETGVPAILNADRYIDVVGTGGDRKNTFNISTTSCFVIAGAGYKVAKHGNYAATSVSGAPKVRAMQLISEYEPHNRGAYGGCIGYIGLDGSLNQAITIRTFVSRNGELWFQAGGGIVAKSDVEYELQEVNNKLGALRKAIIKAEEL